MVMTQRTQGNVIVMKHRKNQVTDKLEIFSPTLVITREWLSPFYFFATCIPSYALINSDLTLKLTSERKRPTDNCTSLLMLLVEYYYLNFVKAESHIKVHREALTLENIYIA